MEKIIDSDGFNAVVKGRYGYVIYNKNDSYVGQAIEQYGEYSEAETALFQHICKEGDIVAEVGANIGSHTLPLSQFVGKSGKVHAFEPQRIVFQTLCANMALNSIENVHCHQVAASSKEGFVFIPEVDYSSQGNFGAVEANKAKSGERVPSTKLQNYLQQLPQLDFLKIDVEGMEFQVIKGATMLIKKHKPFMYVENDRPENSKELIELIWSLGYETYWHIPPMYNPNNYANNPENIYDRTASANMICVPKGTAFNYPETYKAVDASLNPVKDGVNTIKQMAP